jgi:cobalt/nickel transport system permease protein
LFGGLALADYGAVGGIPVGVAGVLGVLVTIAVGWALFRWATRHSDVAKAGTPTNAKSLGG